MKQFYLFILLITFYAVAFPQQSRLAVIGSSTANGQGAYPEDSAWVRRVNYYYKYQTTVVDTTYKLAMNGYSCYKGMPSSYSNPDPALNPDINRNVTMAVNLLRSLPVPANGVIIVNYPSNGYVDFTIPDIMRCLQTIYDSATRLGNRCYITTTQPRTDGSFGTSDIKKKMADIKDSIINRFTVAHTLNFWDGMFNPADTTILPQYSAGDNIHFNNAGHQVLAQRVIARNIFSINPLPVSIEKFGGLLQNNRVILEWTAICDTPQASFTIQRSNDGINFQTLQVIYPRQSSIAKQFRWTDEHPLAGINEYRIRVNQGSSYSRIFAVNNKVFPLEASRIYPVPATTNLYLLLNATAKRTVICNIVNASGVRLQQFSRAVNEGQRTLTFPVGLLPAGNYFLQVQSPGMGPSLYSFVKLEH